MHTLFILIDLYHQPIYKSIHGDNEIVDVFLHFEDGSSKPYEPPGSAQSIIISVMVIVYECEEEKHGMESTHSL